MQDYSRNVNNKHWLHLPELLVRGSLVYKVKFYGSEEVSEPKGTMPVKEALGKMQANKEAKHNGKRRRTPHAELHISVHGISIHDEHTKMTLHKYPLHLISFCADDKLEKKLFTFIVKDSLSGGYRCFVMGSEKNAEEITLTLGQAFDLAYKQSLDIQEVDLEHQQQLLILQQQIHSLQEENTKLKKRLVEVESSCARSETQASCDTPAIVVNRPLINSRTSLARLLSEKPSLSVGFEDDFNPVLSAGTGNSYGQLSNRSPDPFELGDLHPLKVDKLTAGLIELQTGFHNGLKIGKDDFDLRSLDPLFCT